MPVIKVDIGTINAEKRRKLIEGLTEAAAGATQIPKQAFTVIVQEYSDENIGVGGLTLDKIKKA